MRRRLQRSVFCVCGILLLMTCLCSFSAWAGEGPARLTSTEPPWEPGEASLSAMHEFFPHGMYWNHILGDEDEGYSVTDTPCSPYTDDEGLHDVEAGVTCNYFEVPGKVWGGWQCCGYARMVTYCYYGSSFENWEKDETLDGIKAGDVLYLEGYGPHYMWILTCKERENGTIAITYGDCNATGMRHHCQIQWDAIGTLNPDTGVMENPLLGDWDVCALYHAPEPLSDERDSTTTGAGQGSTATEQEPTVTAQNATGVEQDPTATAWDPIEGNPVTVQYALAGGTVSAPVYDIDENGVLFATGTAKATTTVMSAEQAEKALLELPNRWGVFRPGYAFAGWSVDPDRQTAVEQLAKQGPMTAEETARWLCRQMAKKTALQLDNARRNGEENVIVYALWVPLSGEDVE